MNTTRHQQTHRRTQQTVHAPTQCDDMPDPLSVVEHTTIPGFIRRCPHRFHITEITRFGNEVTKIAEAMQISYLTTIDRSLGMIRLFPVPLLTRVYQVMAAQFGWEQIVEVPAEPKDAPKVNDRVKKQLREAVAEAAGHPEVMQAMETVLRWLEKEPAPATPTLRSI